MARWIRLGEPEVNPGDSYGITGPNGTRHSYTGIGQSLVIVPFDALVDAVVIAQLDRFQLDPARKRQVAELTIAFLMQSFVTACLLLVAYELLLSFHFSRFASAAGAVGLLFATSCLAYVQCAQENELLLLLALCALWGVRRFTLDGRVWWAAIAGSACAFAILTRANSLLDAAIVAAYAVSTGVPRKRFFAAYLPPIVAAIAIDRWYQYYRFGSIFNTYMGIAGEQLRPPGAPASYPFSYPFWKGFFGTLLSPDKSIFLFDPLLIMLLMLVLITWRKLGIDLKRLLGWLALLELLYIIISARYVAFGGDVAWGHRYVIMPVQLLSLFTIPVLLAHGSDLSIWARRTLWVMVVAAAVQQAAATAIAPNLEISQRQMGYDHGVVWNRAVNIAEIATNRETPARFTGVPIEWRTLAYLPFQLRFRFPALARWAIPGWLALLACLPLLVVAILRSANQPAR